MKLPMTIYAIIEEDGDDSYLVANKDTDLIEDGSEVGTYELVSTDILQVTRKLV